MPLYEGKSFWLHDPYFGGRGQTRGSSRFIKRSSMRELVDYDAWTVPRVAFRNVASATNQRTLVVAVIPPCAHGHGVGSLGRLNRATTSLAAVLASLVIDYVLRMKVSANLSWFQLETLPIPLPSEDGEHARKIDELVRGLNFVGADYPAPSATALTDADARMAARLVIDAVVAHLLGLAVDDLDHIAEQFPIYDRDAPAALRYPRLAVEVFTTMLSEGLEHAETRAAALIAERRRVGCGFGLDELWQPEGGWEQANREARAILEEGRLA
jgi:hypothetical protein